VGAWALSALLVAVGGAGFVLAILWLLQQVIGLLDGGRLIGSIEQGLLALGITLGIVAFVSWWFVSSVAGGCLRGFIIALVWVIGYLALWGLGASYLRVSLPMYIGFWVVAGLVIGLVLAALPTQRRSERRRRGAAPRATGSVVRASQFGRIPADTVVLLTRQVRQVQDAVKGGLPESAPRSAIDFATGTLLEHTVRDWWQNGNTAGLTPQDADDLRSFVALATAVASPAALRSPEGEAVFRATLAALADDWLDNWNANGVSGPPQR
jgi:hypothetical protein